MNRRDFVRRSIEIGTLAPLSGAAFGASPIDPASRSAPFTLRYAPEFGLFSDAAGEDVVDQIQFGYDHGFRAWEDTFLLDKTVDEQEQISSALQKRGMDFGMFVGHVTFEAVTFAGNDDTTRERVLDEVRRSAEVARRMNTEFVHIVLGRAHPSLKEGYQMANAIDLLRRCRDILGKHNLTMIIEPMNHRIDHPGMFLHEVSQAHALCTAVEGPCRLLFDIYHVQIQEGNLIPNIDQAWDQIAYFQVGDTPGRNEPLSGEINYRTVFAHIHRKGYEGFLGLEHGTSQPGADGERAVVKAYRTCDPTGSQAE